MDTKVTVLAAGLMVTSLAFAQWESVDTWDMNSSGELQISDNGTNLGNPYNTNTQQVAQNPGDGLFIFSPDSASNFGAKSEFSSTTDLTANQVRLTWTYDSLDFSTNAAANTKHGIRLWNAAETDWVGISIEDDGNNDNVFVYLKDGDGIFGNNTKLGRLVKGLGPDAVSRTFQMVLDYENNEIIVSSDNWQWSGNNPDNKGPVYVQSYDFATNGLTDVSRFQLFHQNWGEGDYLTQDLLSIERQSSADPLGVFIEDKASYLSANVAETNSPVASFAVTNGDWIVVQAGVNNAKWDESSLSFSGLVSEVSYQFNNAGGPNTHLWYAPVYSAGTVNIELNVDEADAAFGAIGAYVVRSSSGDADILTIAEAGSVSNAGPSVVMSYTNVYDFGKSTTGLLIEAFSAYAADMSLDNGDFVVDANQGSFKRVVGSASFSGVSAVTNVYSTVVTNRQAAVLGIAFSTSLSPEDKYATWLQGYPGVGDDIELTDDADGDFLDNLGEYALGGHPADDTDRGNYPIQFQVSDGGVNYIEYVHYERSDKQNRGLEYIVEVNTTGLTLDNWSTAGIDFVGSGAGPAGYSAYTNRVSIDDGEHKFIRLQIEFTP